MAIMDLNELKKKLELDSLTKEKDSKDNITDKNSKNAKVIKDSKNIKNAKSIKDIKKKETKESIIKNDKSKDSKEKDNSSKITNSDNNEENVKKYFNTDLSKEISSKLGVNKKVSDNIIEMLDEGNTVPFISRYRKERTGGMDDEALREFESTLKSLKNLLDRKQEVLRIIDELGELTDDIVSSTIKATTLTEVEDIYRPFKKKKKTRATEAKRKGLEPLALEFKKDVDFSYITNLAKDFLNDEVLTVEDAISGAYDIIAEEISDSPDVRKIVKKIYLNESKIETKKKKAKKDEEDSDPKEIYKMYYEFEEMVKSMPSHRYLALTRGEKEGALSVNFVLDEDKVLAKIFDNISKEYSEKLKSEIMEIVKDAFKRLIKSSVETEIRKDLKEKSDAAAIEIFGKNLKQLLLMPPIKGQNILGFDPGFRNGCKIATIDHNGMFKSQMKIYIAMSKDREKQGIENLKRLVEKDDIDIIAIGNGTASRESEKLVSEMIKGTKVKYAIVSEAGASVYSASKLATEEFPNVDVSIRGAISIARRLQDPLSELVKIDPKSIGVGQYQHDVNQKELEESLSNVVEDSVNKVGVDLNTATFSLISYVAGLSKRQAKNIVKYREENGSFKVRGEIAKVSGIGDVSLMQSIGFFRIYNGEDPFDITGIHPETYALAENILNIIGFDKKDILNENKKKEIDEKLKQYNTLKLTKLLNDKIKANGDSTEETSQVVVEDIVKEILNPGLDIRKELEKPILRSDVLTFDDIHEGMVLKGTVRNVAAFGAFIDVGLHNDALVHISELSDKYVKDPLDIVKVGDIVEVKVIEKEAKNERVSLSMKGL